MVRTCRLNASGKISTFNHVQSTEYRPEKTVLVVVVLIAAVLEAVVVVVVRVIKSDTRNH